MIADALVTLPRSDGQSRIRWCLLEVFRYGLVGGLVVLVGWILTVAFASITYASEPPSPVQLYRSGHGWCMGMPHGARAEDEPVWLVDTCFGQGSHAVMSGRGYVMCLRPHHPLLNDAYPRGTAVGVCDAWASQGAP